MRLATPTAMLDAALSEAQRSSAAREALIDASLAAGEWPEPAALAARDAALDAAMDRLHIVIMGFTALALRELEERRAA